MRVLTFDLSRDAGQRKRLADVAEKLGVALIVGSVLQVVLPPEIETSRFLVGSVFIVGGFILIVMSVFLSRSQ